jgi:hypothetical protein
MGTCTSTAARRPRFNQQHLRQQRPLLSACKAILRYSSGQFDLHDLLAGFCRPHCKLPVALGTVVPGGSVDAVRFRSMTLTLTLTACVACKGCRSDQQLMMLINLHVSCYSRYPLHMPCTLTAAHVHWIKADQSLYVHRL